MSLLIMTEYQYWQEKIGETEIAGTDIWYLVYFKTECYDQICDSDKYRYPPRENAFSSFNFPGLYLLLDTTKKEVYVGESSDVKIRIKQHMDLDQAQKIVEFDRISLIWDGRPTVTSHLGNEALRKSLEKECIRLWDSYSEYEVANHVKGAKETNIRVESATIRFTDELAFLFAKFFGHKD